MPPQLLIPVDESDTTQGTIAALLNNRDLLQRGFILLHVVDVHLAHRLVPDIQKNMVYEAAEKSGRRILEKLAEPFRQAGFEPVLRLELGTPETTILKVAEEQKSELVVLGRHPVGGGLRDTMYGSVTNHVIRTVKCPVLLF